MKPVTAAIPASTASRFHSQRPHAQLSSSDTQSRPLTLMFDCHLVRRAAVGLCPWFASHRRVRRLPAESRLRAFFGVALDLLGIQTVAHLAFALAVVAQFRSVLLSLVGFIVSRVWTGVKCVVRKLRHQPRAIW